MTWWETEKWRTYERHYGDAPGARAAQLASATWNTQVVDLSVGEPALWAGLRHSYRPLIKKVQRECLVDVAPVRFQAVARMMHREASGRDTRPIQTWADMDDWAIDGHGCWVSATPRGTTDPVGYAYAAHYGLWAYYFSAVAQRPNVGHALVWQLMLESKKRGIRWFEVGWHERPTDTDKERSICFFRRGFGGFSVLAKDAASRCER